MELIVRPPRRYHVSHDTVDELEQAILADPRVVPARLNAALERIVVGATRLMQRVGTDMGSLLRVRQRSSVAGTPARDYLAVMMELDAAKSAPWFIRTARRSIYVFDAWPSRHRDIRAFVESWGIQYAFVSSSQAAARLAELCDSCTFIWVPEGVDPAQYQALPLFEKDIDVLQLGRKYDAHHTVIAPALESAGKTYLYESPRGTIIFPQRDEFVAGLARSRISICVPSSITHPERAGDIETMTVRYLQSIVSKCVVLGHAPVEMVELFGYNPVVEIDMLNPAGQLLDILSHYEDYLPLVERNFDIVTREHTWRNRWQQMAAVLLQ
jgi:hypothetical protein